jgi:hypothetical protein
MTTVKTLSTLLSAGLTKSIKKKSPEIGKLAQPEKSLMKLQKRD